MIATTAESTVRPASKPNGRVVRIYIVCLLEGSMGRVGYEVTCGKPLGVLWMEKQKGKKK